MHARNKKILTTFAVGFLILSSVGVAAQDSERTTLEYNENMERPEPIFSKGLSAERVNGITMENGYMVVGTSNYNVYSWIPQTNYSNGSHFSTVIGNGLTNLPYSVSDNAGTGFTTVENKSNPIDPHITAEYVWGKRTLANGEHSGTYLSSDNNGTVIFDASSYNNDGDNIGSAATTTFNNGGEVAILEYVEDISQSPSALLIYYPNNNTVNQLTSLNFNTANRNTVIQAYNPNPKELIVTNYLTEESIIIDKATGGAKKIQNPVLEIANGKLMVGVSEGFNGYKASTFVDRVMDKPLENVTAIHKINSPAVTIDGYSSQTGQYDRITYIGGYWFMTDSDSEIQPGVTLAYNRDLTDIATGFTTSFNNDDNDEKLYHYFIDNEQIKLIDESERFSGSLYISQYDTGLSVEITCARNFNPHTLSKFWVTPNVCWLPIFLGKGLLVSIYQWLMLAVLIAMPIAKETKSDIATMATIDGVLLIGMLIGNISPGYVAVAILATILLSVYGMSGTDVEINNMGGGGI